MRARHTPKGVGYLISRLRVELAAALDVRLAADGQLGPLELSAAQYTVIATLAAAESKMSSTALCKRLSYDGGAMTRMLDRLEAKQLIGRKRCTEDRRRRYVELTDEARAAFPRMREISGDVVNHSLRGFSPAEIRQLESYLTRMLQNAHLFGGQPAPYVGKKSVVARSTA